MTFMRHALVVFVLLVGAAATTSAQVTTGTPPFAALTGGPDKVNLANLNVDLPIAVHSKAGRKISVVYNLGFNSSLWFPTGSSGSQSWQPIASWGFTGYPTTLLGYYGSINDAVGCSGYCSYDYSYTDASGTLHPFPNYSCTYGTGCPGSPASQDGSGYTFNGNGVTDRSGIITIPRVTNLGIRTDQDTNGNYISATNPSGTTYVITDTLGQAALTLSGSGTPSSPVTIQYTAPSGATATYTIKYVSKTVRTHFGCSGISEYGPTANNLVSEMDLPDGTKYTFTYEMTPGYSADVTGRLASVTLPTGGTIYYTYTGGNNGIECADGSTAGLTRQTSDGTWSYSRTLGTSPASTTTVTDPQNNQTVMNFQGIYPTEEQVYQGSQTSGTLLRTALFCYNGTTPSGTPATCNSASITLPITQRTSYTLWPGGLESEVNTLYDSETSNGFNYSYGLINEIDEYAYGNGAPGSLVRKTLTSYATLSNGIMDRPSQITVEDGSGNVRSQETFSYDQGSVTATSGTPQQISVTGSRGNITTKSYLVSGTTTLSKSFAYFDTGLVQTATRVNGSQVSYTYGACGNSFPTLVNEPLGLSKSMAWNCTGGVETSLTDENNQITSTAYTDPYFWRPNSTTDQLSNVTSLTYSGQTSAAATLNFNGSSSTVDVRLAMDGLGRSRVRQTEQGPGSTTFDSVETDYDGDGRPYRTTLPYSGSAGQLCSGSCPAAKTITYDALNRTLQATDGGGGYVSYSYSQNDVLMTAGPAPSGENTKRKQLEYDALGRLTSVCEITAATGSGTCAQTSPATGYWTKYTYDANNNLTGVTQNAQSGSAQTRAFAYDDLGRLTSETTPESGTTTYTYDSETTCGTSNGDLVKKLDAIGNVTCYSYDALHRLTSVTYPSGPYASVTPGKYFVYDAATVNSTSMANAKGRDAEAYTCFSPCSSKLTDVGLSYTVRGEVTDVYESTPHSGGYYHVNEAYWANGVVKQSSGLSGLPTISYGVDGEGRVYSAAASSGQNPLSSTTYNAANLTTAVNLGSSDGDLFAYDPNTYRMTQYTFSVNGQSIIGSLTWNTLGTLGSILVTDPFDSSNTQSCSYSHDDLVRVASVNCGSIWSQTFSYDAFGNIQKSGSMSFGATYSYLTNRMTEIGSSSPTYDSDGNVTNDFLHAYAWDANGRPVTLDSIGITYDALGRMVEQNRIGAYTEIVYTPSGAKLALMNGSTLQKAFVSLTGGSVAVYNSSGLAYYRHSDWNGSSRLASTPSRTMYSDGAYAPFGEPYAQSGTIDLSFTGKNQDTAPNAYDFQAREYGIQGRWPSPDPAGTSSVRRNDPQTWNRYAYVRNSPLGMTDPTGMQDGLDYYDSPGGNGGNDGGGNSELMNEANDWLDTVFGAQNGNYGGAIWDQYILQTTFGAGTPNDHNNDLPNINDESGVNPNTDARDWVEYQLVYWNAQTGQADWDTDIVCQNETCQKAKEWHWTNVRPPPECDFGDECAIQGTFGKLGNLDRNIGEMYLIGTVTAAAAPYAVGNCIIYARACVALVTAAALLYEEMHPPSGPHEEQAGPPQTQHNPDNEPDGGYIGPEKPPVSGPAPEPEE